MSHNKFACKILSMKRCFLIFMCAFLLTLSAVRLSLAATEAGEAYVFPTYEELIQTAVMFGGLDAKEKPILEEYIRLIYCDLYLKNYRDDFAWEGIRSKIGERIKSKNEYYRTLYQVLGKIRLGEYNHRVGFFPLTKDTDFDRVGTISLFNPKLFEPYCDMMDGHSNMRADYLLVLPRSINVNLSRPFTFKVLRMDKKKAEAFINSMSLMRTTNRELYVQLRIRMLGAEPKKERAISLIGTVVGADIFLDKEMKHWVAKVPVDLGETYQNSPTP